MMNYREFTMPRDPVRNVLHRAIQDKHDQIKRSGHVAGEGWRCVILCDGNCAALTGARFRVPPHVGQPRARLKDATEGARPARRSR